MDSVKNAIRNAISLGAPLYNAGNPAACYQEYKKTATSLLDAAEATADEQALLRSALSEAGTTADPDSAAWTMRRAFDKILANAVPPLTLPIPASGRRCLINFSSGLPADPRWFSVDDSVMGGVSSSGIMPDSQTGAVAFQGNVTTANNGGFASVRSAPWSGWSGLHGAEAVELEVQGDGRTYKLNLKTDDAYDGISYQCDFVTRATAGPSSSSSSSSEDAWERVRLPLEDFKPTFRGRVVSNAPKLQGGNVRQLGFMVSKFADNGGFIDGFRPGQFRLAIRAVNASFGIQ